MKETKNKNIILIALSICLVIIMFIVYFSSSNVAKGTYGTEVNLSEYSCESGNPFVYNYQAYCCPAGYKQSYGQCIPDGCQSSSIIRELEVTCQTVAKDCYEDSNDYKWYKDFSASFDGKTCKSKTKDTTFIGEDSSSAKNNCTAAQPSDYSCYCNCNDLAQELILASKNCETGQTKDSDGNCVDDEVDDESVTITYNPNNGTCNNPGSFECEKGKTCPGANDPKCSLSGYEFIGWVDVNGNGVTDSYIYNTDTVLKASWGDKKELKFYNGNVLVKTVTCSSTECEVQFPASTSIATSGYSFRKDGDNTSDYEFIGWGGVLCKTQKSDQNILASANEKKTIKYTDIVQNPTTYYACYKYVGTSSEDVKCSKDSDCSSDKLCSTTDKICKTAYCYSHENKNGSGTSYQWSISSPGTDTDWKLESDKTTKEACSSGTTSTSCDSNSGTYNTETACKNAYSGYTCNTNDDGCWIKGEKISGSTGTGGGSTGGDGGSGNTGGNSNTTPTTPSSDPSSSSSSSSSSSVSSSSSSSSNATSNPQTGAISIFIIWIIALGTIVYAFCYFKQSRFE